MTALRFDPALARDVIDAFRLLDGRLLGCDRQLSPGALELIRAAELSGAVRSSQPSAGGLDPDDDESMSPRLLTIAEAQARINVSESTVRRLIRSGELPVVHLGKRVRIHTSDLNEFLENLRTKDTAA